MVNLFGIDENLGTNGVVTQPANIIFLQENNIVYTFNDNLLQKKQETFLISYFQ